MSFVALYVGFAVIAVVVNLGVQRFVFLIGSEIGSKGSVLIFLLALAAGTLAGLITKYLLDKRWIFRDQSRDHGRKFALYSLMGLATTAIFWGSETTFWLIWRTDTMREVGALLGLTVGYAIKYYLDRRYVF